MLILIKFILIVLFVTLLASMLFICCAHLYYKFAPSKSIERNPDLKYSQSDRYVHFTDGGIKVDVARYLKTPEGKAAVDRIQKSSERFRK